MRNLPALAVRAVGALLAAVVLLTVVSSAAWAQPDDAEIAEQVRRALAPLEGLEELEVSVSGGVVVLEGRAASDDAATRAKEIAGKVEGAIEVESRLTPTRSVKRRLAPVWSRLREVLARTWAWLPLFGVALAVFVVIWFLAKLVASWDWVFRRMSSNRFARDLLRQVVRMSIVVGGLVLALEILDATAIVGAVLGAAGLAGLALGLAFRDLFENYLASVLLSLRRPFAPGDHVRVGGDEGHVVGLTTRSTTLRTLDGNQLRILNADVYKSRILNYTRDPLRRFGFAVGVGVGEDLSAARELGLQTMRDMHGVVADPPPLVLVEELGDSSVILRHHAWVDQGEVDFLKARGEAIRLVKQAFDEAGFDMPEPIQRVRLERASRGRAEKEPVHTGPAEAQDLAPDPHIEARIAEEREELGEEDLLGHGDATG